MKDILEDQSDFQSALFWLLTGAAIGWMATYFLDPIQGKRRRVLVRDRGVSLQRESISRGRRVARHIKNRAVGMAAEIMPRRQTQRVDDSTLNERVRSELGRVIPHARSIDTTVEEGIVRLTGDILASEVDDLLKCVKKVKGVLSVINHLHVHQTPDNVPSLQGLH